MRTSNAVRHGHDNDDGSIQNELESSSNFSVPSSYRKEMKPYSTAYVPPYCIWVEGDNFDNSVDGSRSHGPLSKKLLVGIAEYRLWPPWRAGKLDNIGTSDIP